MMFDLANQKFCVFGLQGSGKTFFAKKVIQEFFKKPFVYRVHNDFDDENVFLYEPFNIYEEFEFFIGKAIEMGKKRKIDCVVIDEADMFFRGYLQPESNINDIVLNHRHYGLSVCFISRRPQDIPTKIVESSKFNFVFAIEGDNVFKKLNNVHENFEIMVRQLTFEKYDFVVKEIGKEPYVHEKI